MTFAYPEVTIRPYFVKPVKANLGPESVHISENSVINSDIFFKSHYFTLTGVLWGMWVKSPGDYEYFEE